MPRPKILSFEKITHGRESTVRITDDGFIYAVDLTMVVTGQNRDHAGKTLRNISDEVFLSENFSYRALPGSGNTRTKLVSLEKAPELIMVLPGKTSKACRKKMADVISRYLNGDLDMIHEIISNNEIGKIKSYLKFAQNAVGDMENENPISFGYVYASSSPAFPGLIKIGKSTNVERRMAQLNTGCAPAPHVILVTAPSFNTTRDERLAHDYFSSYRREGEFFQVSGEDVSEYFKL